MRVFKRSSWRLWRSPHRASPILGISSPRGELLQRNFTSRFSPCGGDLLPIRHTAFEFSSSSSTSLPTTTTSFSSTRQPLPTSPTFPCLHIKPLQTCIPTMASIGAVKAKGKKEKAKIKTENLIQGEDGNGESNIDGNIELRPATSFRKRASWVQLLLSPLSIIFPSKPKCNELTLSKSYYPRKVTHVRNIRKSKNQDLSQGSPSLSFNSKVKHSQGPSSLSSRSIMDSSQELSLPSNLDFSQPPYLPHFPSTIKPSQNPPLPSQASKVKLTNLKNAIQLHNVTSTTANASKSKNKEPSQEPPVFVSFHSNMQPPTLIKTTKLDNLTFTTRNISKARRKGPSQHPPLLSLQSKIISPTLIKGGKLHNLGSSSPNIEYYINQIEPHKDIQGAILHCKQSITM